MDDKHLNRSLTLFPATAIVIGSVVGSGIFVSSAQMARDLKSAGLLLAVWVFTGIMTLFGAFTQCELLGQMPSTGGLYRYLRDIYGEGIGFLYGWANFIIAGSGAIAALAFLCASYLSEFIALPHLSRALEKWAVSIPFVGSIFPLADIGVKAIGSLLIIFLTTLNARGIKLGALVQSVSTSAKIMAIIGIIASAFLLHPAHSANSFLSLRSAPVGFALVGAIVASMSSAFWAYDGWGNVSYIAGEVMKPEKTLPRAIVIGTLAFIGLYLFVNLAYLYVLPIDAIGSAQGDRVAATLMTATLGSKGAVLVAVLIILSTFDTTNSSILTNARVYYAMAQDRIFAPGAAKVHANYQTPHLALIYQGLWAVILLVSGSFDLITSMYVFVNWLLYLLQGIGVFVLRVRHPKASRPFKTPGYPLIPVIFIVFSASFVCLTLVNDISEFNAGHVPIIKSVMGAILVMTGLPFYFYWKAQSKVSSFDPAK